MVAGVQVFVVDINNDGCLIFICAVWGNMKFEQQQDHCLLVKVLIKWCSFYEDEAKKIWIKFFGILHPKLLF